MNRLRLLDQQKAVELGLADDNAIRPGDAISVADGWNFYLEYGGRSRVLGGVSPGTLQRYGAVRDKHVKFCAKHGIVNWGDFSKQMMEKYGNRLSRSFADRTVFLELTLIKSVTN
ncbi:MAG: hypothetical protein HQ567_13790 [Candidatus Nealsonbacteria bacterium]|nr:hypothetical protein [Candidatus Nealsonbacteria bacterium]